MVYALYLWHMQLCIGALMRRRLMRRTICWFSVEDILQALPVVQWEMSGRGNGPKQIIGWLSEPPLRIGAHPVTSQV